MTSGRKHFRITLWDHSFFAIDIFAATEAEALRLAENQYAAAKPGSCAGFDLLDNHSDDWEVRDVSPPLPLRGCGGCG